MTNDYVMPEVVEIGEANKFILGAKFITDMDYDGETIMVDGDLDD